MSRVLYYLFLKPISFLPFSALYLLSDFLNFILFRCAGYRKKVIRSNFTNSFPEKPIKEIKSIERQFHRHFCDLIVESIRMMSISEKELTERVRVVNPALLDRFYDEGKNLILVAGHYNNWEMPAAILSTQVKHHIVGIYAPLSNKFFDDQILESRQKFGLEMISKKLVKEGFEKNKGRLTATLFATDQSPTYSKRVHWTKFLNQETAVLGGSERFSKEYNFPVVFASITKIRRGYYEIEFKLLEENPAGTPDGTITEKHTRWLEQQIIAKPQYWLWTHKRWKRKMKEGDVLYCVS